MYDAEIGILITLLGVEVMWFAGWEKCTYPVPVEAAVVQNCIQIILAPDYNRLQGDMP